MSNISQIKDALATITADSEQTLAIIDAEIDSLQAGIQQLQKTRRLLCGKPRRRVQQDSPKAADSYSQCEQQIIAAIRKHGRMTCADLTSHVKFPKVIIGKTVSRSSLLSKGGTGGSLVCLVES